MCSLPYKKGQTLDGMVYKGDWNMRGARTGLEEEGVLGREQENAIRKVYQMFKNEKGQR